MGVHDKAGAGVTSVCYEVLLPEDIQEGFLTGFDRYQVTKRVMYWDDGQLLSKEDAWVDTWDEARLRSVERELADCTINGGAVVAACSEKRVIGFAGLEGRAFGSQNQYRELAMMHVSREWRGRGVGKRLFAMICDCAQARGAQKLYISSHPSWETQAFYRSVGCTPAVEVDEQIFALEPLDIQLECSLATAGVALK